VLMDRAELARRLARAAEGVPGVSEVTGGPAVAEYGAGGMVSGVVLSGPDEALQATVSVTARYADGLDLQRLGNQVRGAVQSAADAHQPESIQGVDVVVADLVFEEEPAQ
jgi:hypothetical protein